MMGFFPVVFSLALIYFRVKAEPNEIFQPAGKDASALTFLSGLEKAFQVFSPDERVCSSNRGLSHPRQLHCIQAVSAIHLYSHWKEAKWKQDNPFSTGITHAVK